MSDDSETLLVFRSTSDWWVRFHKDIKQRAGITYSNDDKFMGVVYIELKQRWNARIIYDKDQREYFIVFNTSEDKIAFLLRWS